jgi:signal transduction histidine kinase/ActR/RegA family two-component response regulator
MMIHYAKELESSADEIPGKPVDMYEMMPQIRMLEGARTAEEVLRAENKRLEEMLHTAITALEQMKKAFHEEEEKNRRLVDTERREKDREIQAAREKAEEASRLKSVILANLSHEFRTPLNGILGVADILLAEVETDIQREMVELIAVSGKRLYRTLDVFMKMAQLAAGELKLDLKPLCCSHIAVKTVRAFRETAEQKNLDLEVEILGDTEIIADERALGDIFHNLIDNALKFTREGKVKVTVEERERSGQAEIAMSVRDTGIGIPLERQGLLFQEFRQLSEGIRRDYEGSGLGLTVAKKMTEIQGGTLTYESEPGVGTAFTVSFPSIIDNESGLPRDGSCPPPPANDDQEVSRPAVPPAPVPRVLVVEDNFINVLIVINYLENICAVDHAENGAGALQKAQEQEYDAFLVDINLGSEMDGLELQKELRRIEKYRSVPIVAVTGYALSGDREDFLSQGFSHYLPKPYEGRDIVALMTGILQQNQGTS